MSTYILASSINIKPTNHQSPAANPHFTNPPYHFPKHSCYMNLQPPLTSPLLCLPYVTLFPSSNVRFSAPLHLTNQEPTLSLLLLNHQLLSWTPHFKTYQRKSSCLATYILLTATTCVACLWVIDKSLHEIKMSLHQCYVLLNVPIICLEISLPFNNKNYSLIIPIFISHPFYSYFLFHLLVGESGQGHRRLT